jgi:hypothetical protein
MNFYDFLSEFIDTVRKKDGYINHFKGGHNGLYNDPETPIRNTCHYIKIISFLMSSSKEMQVKYLVELERFESYILNNFFYGYTYECRNKKGKDSANGIIGTAWVAEGLSGECHNIVHIF